MNILLQQHRTNAATTWNNYCNMRLKQLKHTATTQKSSATATSIETYCNNGVSLLLHTKSACATPKFHYCYIWILVMQQHIT
jgi:hypothetical protein